MLQYYGISIRILYTSLNDGSMSFGVYSQLIILPVLDSIESILLDCTLNELTNTFTVQTSFLRALFMTATEE